MFDHPQRKYRQVFCSYSSLLRLLETPADPHGMHPQPVGNLSQPIPILPIGHRNLPDLVSSALKERTERRSSSLGLSTGNVSNHPIRLMMCDESLRTQVDLSFELVPGPRPLSPGRNKFPIADLGFPLPDAKLPQNPVRREPAWRRTLSDRVSITTPPPTPWMGHHLGPNWIEHDIAAEFKEMRLFLHQNGGEPALKEMAHPLVAAVDGLSIGAIELPHALREIRLWRFDQEMIVVIHQTVGMAVPAKPIDHMG